MKINPVAAVVLLSVVSFGCNTEKSMPTGPTPPTPPVATPPPPTPSPTPPPQSNPGAFFEGLVSFNFDDGRTSAYMNAIPKLDAAGLKSTNYIITGRLGASTYIGVTEVLSLQSRGHEIGAHTRSHMDLTTLPRAQAQDEVSGSRSDLFKIGVRSVETFAYPFGAYNPGVIILARDAGFTSARSTNGGFNLRTADRYVLARQNLGGNITIQQVRSWVDSAVQNKTWLVLVTHNVDNSVSDFSITPNFFQEVVNYIKEKRVRVVTMLEGSRMLGS